MDSLWISIASILAGFDIAKAKDEQGQVVEPDIKWAPGFSRYVPTKFSKAPLWSIYTVRQMLPFKCSITPRSAEAIKLIGDSELM